MSEHDVASRVIEPSLVADRNVVLFEDERTHVDLFPLAVMRPSWKVRCGAGCLRQWIAALNAPGSSLLLRPRESIASLARALAAREDDEPDPEMETIFINGRVIGLWKSDERAVDFPRTVVDREGRVLIARRSGAVAYKLLSQSGNELHRSLVQDAEGNDLPAGWCLRTADYSWDFMRHNHELLERQFATSRSSSELLGAHVLREMPSGVCLSGRAGGHPVYVGHNVKLMPGVIIGNHLGSVWIGDDTEVEPHTYLEGPLFIGDHCRIKAGARFYHGCSLGPQCRVAGEISSSILQSFVNKQHEGFLGNSHVCSWANLGADTRTSNLKNDYSEVKVQVGDRLVATGEQFIGLMMGDHSKTGINTMFNTGTVVGVAANVYGAGYPPRFINSFMWGGLDDLKPGALDRTLAAARIAMPRRGVSLSDVEELLLRRHYAELVNSETHS